MSRIALALRILPWLWLAAPWSAHAQTLPSQIVDAGRLAWTAASLALAKDPALVRLPVATTARGSAQIGPQQWAGVWLEPMRSVRVRVLTPGAMLRTVRTLPSSAAAALGAPRNALATVSQAIDLGPDGHAWLFQPAGQSSIFWIAADRPAQVVVERPTPAVPRLAWEGFRRQLLSWIEQGGDLPTLPTQSGVAEVRSRWLAERALGERLMTEFGVGEPALRELVLAVRAASIEAGLDTLRSWFTPYYSVREIRPEGLAQGGAVVLSAVSDDRVAQDAVDANRTWLRGDGDSVRASGVAKLGGAVRLDVRALFAPDRPPVTRPLRVRLWTGEEVAFDRTFEARPVATADEAVLGGEQWLQTEVGEAVGALMRATVTIPRGTSFRFEVEGGPALVRLIEGVRRPWAQEDWKRAGSRLAWAERAKAALGGLRDMKLREAACSFARPWGTACPKRVQPNSREALPVLAALYAIAVGPTDTGAAVDGRSAAALALAPAELGWWLRARLAEQALSVGDAPRAQLWLDDVSSRPPAQLVPWLLQLLDAWPSRTGTQSARVAVLEHSRSVDPLDEELARTYQRVLWDRTRWRALTPQPANPQVPVAAPIGMVVRRDPNAERPRTAQPPPEGALWLLAQGAPVEIRVPAAEVESRRLALLHVLGWVPLGRVVLNVDGRRFQAAGSGVEEHWEIAVTPGRHTVSLEQAPAGAEVYLRAARVDAGASDWQAELAQAWPVREAGVSLRYEIPPNAGPIRVRLRPPPEAAAGAWLFSDVGDPVRMQWPASEPDPGSQTLDSQLRLRRPVDLVWMPPKGSRYVWVEADDDRPLFVEVAVRGEHSPVRSADAVTAGMKLTQSGDQGSHDAIAAPPAGDAPTEASLAADELWQLSREALDPATATVAHADRAQRLLELSYFRNAQADVAWLLKRAAESRDATLAGQAIALQGELRQWRSSDYVRGAPDLLAMGGPLALSAALFPDNVPESQVDAASHDLSVRRAGAELPDAPPDDEPGFYAFVRALAEREEVERAASLATQRYQRDHLISWGLEACALWLRAMDAKGPVKGTGVAHGVAEELLSRLAHPLVRELRARAGRASESALVRGTDRNAGELRLRAWGRADEPTPWLQAQHALVAPPWDPRSASLVTPGRVFQLELTVGSATQLAPDLWCGQLPGAAPSAVACAGSFRVDANPAMAVRVPLGQVMQLPPLALGPGAHVIEVALAPAQEVLLSVRFGADRAFAGVAADQGARGGFSVTRARESRVYRSHANAPVIATVLGPATLNVISRAMGAGAERRVRLRVFGTSAVPVYDTSASLSVQPDANVALVDLPGIALSAPLPTPVWLVEPVSYRVEVEGMGGDVLVAFATRRDLDVPAKDPAPLPREIASDLLAPSWLQAFAGPAVSRERSAVPGHGSDLPIDLPAVGSLGLVSAELDAGRLDVEERDITRLDRVWYLEPSLAYRHRLLDQRLFLMGGLATRATTEQNFVIRPRAQALIVGMPLHTRIWLDADAALQSYHSRIESQFRASLRVDGVYWVSRHVALIPALQYRERWLSQSQPASPTPQTPQAHALDPTVFTTYAATHHRSLAPSLNVRYQPFQDHVGSLRLRAATNEDVRTWDQADVRAMWAWLSPLDRWGSLEVDLRYQPAARFTDRDRNPGYLRHDAGIDLLWCWWRRGGDRVCWMVSDTVYLSSVIRDQNIGWTGLRYDFTHGRRLFDLTPADLNFDEVQGNRQWEGAPWQTP